MTEPNVLAQDLMVKPVRCLVGERPVREGMDLLAALREDPGEPNVFGVVEEDGSFEGVLTARLLLRSLLALWRPARAVREDAARHDQELLELARERCKLPVRNMLHPGLPSAEPEDRLPRLVELACEERMEFLPVLRDRRLVGVVPIGRLFHAVASLALRPEDEGIHTR